MVGYETGMWSLTGEGEKSGKTVILVLLVKGLITAQVQVMNISY